MGEIMQYIVATALSVVALGSLSYYAWLHFNKRDLIMTGGVLMFVATIPLLLETYYKGADDGLAFGFLLVPAWMALIVGSGLVLAGAFFAHRRDMGEVEEEPEIIEEFKAENDFSEFLKSKQDEFFEQLEDPAARGKADALAKDGPFPKTGDEAPVSGGYEANLRKRYATEGRRYLQEFIRNLKAGLRRSIKELTSLQTSIKKNHYPDNARGIYLKGLHRVRPEDLRRAAQEHKEAEGQARVFRDQCGLEPGEQVDYAKRRTLLTTLIVFFLLFLPIEIGLSLMTLKGDIGDWKSVEIGLYMAFFIVAAAFGIGYLWQWTKRNTKTILRGLCRIGAVALFTAYFAVLGAAMHARNEDTGIGIVGTYKGYLGLFDSLALLAIFVVNIAAFFIAVREAVITFNRFHGWDNIRDRLEEAEDHWDDLEDQVRESTTHAIEDTQAMCGKHRETKDRLVSDIKIKHNALKNISKESIAAYALVFSSQFDQDVNEYRQANCEYRSQLYGPPAYFDHVDPITFEETAREICSAELTDIPSDEEVNEALQGIEHIQQEARVWTEEEGQLRKLFNDNDRAMTECAKQDIAYKPSPELDPAGAQS